MNIVIRPRVGLTYLLPKKHGRPSLSQATALFLQDGPALAGPPCGGARYPSHPTPYHLPTGTQHTGQIPDPQAGRQLKLGKPREVVRL